MKQELPFKIILEKPPANVDFGIQKGSGNNYETIQKQRSGGFDLTFNFTVTVKSSKDLSPDFLGALVHGPAGGRFVYIDIGTYAGQLDSEWSRRLKIPLTGITGEMINCLSDDPGMALQAYVPGTGKDGTPTCATVKPFSGWHPMP